MTVRGDDHEAARHWCRSAERGDFVETKGGPAGWTGTSWSAGPTFVDWNRTRRAPAPPELVEALKQIVFACATLNANGVARTPLRLYATSRSGQHRPKALTRRLETRRERSLRSAPHLHRFTKTADAIDEILEHPLLDAVNRVNPDWDHNALLRHAVFSLDVIGRAYWWMEPGRGAAVANVWPLLAQYVLPIRDPVSSLVGAYRYFDHEYQPGELVRMRHASLRDPYALGLAPAEAAFAYVGLADQFVSLQENLLTQGARPSLLVSSKDPAEPIGKEERARFQRDINAAFTRGGAGMAWVVDGAVDVKPLTFPPADLAALQISENAVQRIANCFGVPLSLLKTEDVNLANAEAGHRQHAELAIDPRCNLIASALTQWTRSEGQRLERGLKARGSTLSLGWDRLFWAFDNPVKEDQERNARVHDLYVKDGVLTINDVRAELGYDRVEWGDEPWLSSSLAQPSSDDGNRSDRQRSGRDEDPSTEAEPSAEAKGIARRPSPFSGPDRSADPCDEDRGKGEVEDADRLPRIFKTRKRKRPKPKPKPKPGGRGRHPGQKPGGSGHGYNPYRDRRTGQFASGPRRNVQASGRARPAAPVVGAHGPKVGSSVAGGRAPKAGTKPNPNKVPSIRAGAFNHWFNALTPAKLKQAWDQPSLRRAIQSRLRQPGGLHEWHMVSRVPTFKQWGVTAEQIAAMRTPISQVRFKNPPGRHGGPGSTTAHNEILNLIDTSSNYGSFKRRLQQWADNRLRGGANALPPGLRPKSHP